MSIKKIAVYQGGQWVTEDIGVDATNIVAGSSLDAGKLLQVGTNGELAVGTSSLNNIVNSINRYSITTSDSENNITYAKESNQYYFSIGGNAYKYIRFYGTSTYPADAQFLIIGFRPGKVNSNLYTGTAILSVVNTTETTEGVTTVSVDAQLSSNTIPDFEIHTTSLIVPGTSNSGVYTDCYRTSVRFDNQVSAQRMFVLIPLYHAHCLVSPVTDMMYIESAS